MKQKLYVATHRGYFRWCKKIPNFMRFHFCLADDKIVRKTPDGDLSGFYFTAFYQNAKKSLK